MSRPLVTIAICCFNAADTVCRAIASAQQQDWDNLEILVCDDASTDGSAELVAELAAADRRIRLIHQPVNGGAGATRRRLVEEARGEFICFFDDDDESHPARVSTQVSRLEDHEGRSGSRLVACYASGVQRFPGGREVDAPGIGSRGKPPQGPAVADYLLVNRRRPDWFYGAGVPTCALLARRSTFLEMGNFDARQRRVQDVEFAIRLALQGGHFIGTTEKLYIRHMTLGADKTQDVVLESWLQLVETHRVYLERIGRYEYARRWPKMRYLYSQRRYGRLALELGTLFCRHPVAVSKHVLATTGTRLALRQ